METPSGVLSLTTGEITSGTIAAAIVVVLGALVKEYLTWSRRGSEKARSDVVLSAEERTAVINQWKAFADQRKEIHEKDIERLSETIQELRREVGKLTKMVSETNEREHKCQVALAVQAQRVDYLTEMVRGLKEQMTQTGIRPDSAIHKMLSIDISTEDQK